MITKERLFAHAKKMGYNLGQTEKDYLQEIILFILYREHGKNLIFKGGTALAKCYGLDRFSEDLDFSSQKTEDYSETINKGLNTFYLEYEFEKKIHTSSIDLTYWIQGPLYAGQKNSTCKIMLDISLREKVSYPPTIKKIGYHIDEIPVFEVVVMSEEEILSEKICALITREKARDLYDIYFLLKKGTTITKQYLETKLEAPNKKINKQVLEIALEKKRTTWKSELSGLLNSFPTFEEAKHTVIDWFNKIENT